MNAQKSIRKALGEFMKGLDFSAVAVQTTGQFEEAEAVNPSASVTSAEEYSDDASEDAEGEAEENEEVTESEESDGKEAFANSAATPGESTGEAARRVETAKATAAADTAQPNIRPQDEHSSSGTVCRLDAVSDTHADFRVPRTSQLHPPGHPSLRNYPLPPTPLHRSLLPSLPRRESAVKTCLTISPPVLAPPHLPMPLSSPRFSSPVRTRTNCPPLSYFCVKVRYTLSKSLAGCVQWRDGRRTEWEVGETKIKGWLL